MRMEEMLLIRKQRGREIAEKGNVTEKDGVWLVPSETSPTKVYEVTLLLGDHRCTCDDYAVRRIKCKHYFAVQYALAHAMKGDGAAPRMKKPTYPQDWKAYDSASTQQKELFLKLLGDLCNNVDEQEYSFGRPRMPQKDMIFASALKVYTTFSLRRFSTDMREAQSKGYISKAPDYSTVARYMESEDMTPILKNLITLTSLPLKTVEDKSFSIDSSGMSPSKFTRWFSHKYGMDMDKKIWYKVHVVTGNKTHIVCAVEITSQFVNDSIMLPQLAKEAHTNFEMPIMTAG